MVLHGKVIVINGIKSLIRYNLVNSITVLIKQEHTYLFYYTVELTKLFLIRINTVNTTLSFPCTKKMTCSQYNRTCSCMSTNNRTTRDRMISVKGKKREIKFEVREGSATRDCSSSRVRTPKISETNVRTKTRVRPRVRSRSWSWPFTRHLPFIMRRNGPSRRI